MREETAYNESRCIYLVTDTKSYHRQDDIVGHGCKARIYADNHFGVSCIVDKAKRYEGIKMKHLYEIREKHQKEMELFPKIKASNEKELLYGMEQLHITDVNDLIPIGDDLYIRKTDISCYQILLLRHAIEEKKAVLHCEEPIFKIKKSKEKEKIKW